MAIHWWGYAVAAWSLLPLAIVIIWAAWPTTRTEVRK